MRRIKYYVFKFVVMAFLGLSILLVFKPHEPAVDRESPPAPAKPETTEISVQDTLSRGESLYASLLSKGIAASKALNVLAVLGQRLNLRSCGTGDSYIASLDETGTIVSLLYRKGFKQLFKVRNDSLGYVVSQGVVEPAGVTRRVEGVIRSSLWEAFTDMGEDPRIALKLADVFAWEIDFVTDPRVGDSFTIVFEELEYPGGEVEIGDILCSKYVNEGKEHLVFRFSDEDGDPGYYDSDGSSARRVFLKSPLSYRRISSFFSNARFHPILKVYRPHHGVDYSAPRGTPIVSIGDGRVVQAGWNGGFGKYVEIRHNNVYASCYGHLSGYGGGVKRGARVSQGQVIGYVGSTGLSTGPHLDFRIKKFDSYVNPLTIDCPRAEPVSADHRQEFFDLRDVMLKALNCNQIAAVGTP